MDKKNSWKVYYYSLVKTVTQSQLKAINEPLEGDFSAIKQWMDKHGIYGIVDGDAEYHRRVQKSPAPPHIFYYKGNLEILNRPVLAIVGPRQMSSYAEQVLVHLFQELSSYDLVTISGLAEGVDSRCHELSIEYGIPTIAVLGGGFGYFLRGRKRELIERIVDHGGVVISEYKHAFIPTNRSFPQRNRLIAGIADIVFLPEAKIKSGSLITVENANERKIPTYAPMNTIFSEASFGTNTYITENKIIPLHNMKDFLVKHFQHRSTTTHTNSSVSLSYTERQIEIMALFNDYETLSLEQVAKILSYEFSELLTEMTYLEMLGVIVESSPGVYKKIVCNAA